SRLTSASDIIRQQIEDGNATRQDFLQSTARQSEARAALADAQGQRESLLNELSVATGTFGPARTQAAVNRTASAPIPPASVSYVPANLIRNRPDIRQLEFSYLSSRVLIDDARASLFPDLSLSGSINGASGTTNVTVRSACSALG
ncbi:MAG: hypothetical protein KJP02_00545, partial [Octadecabacter sp.]|nr:hypothetical protein [Octadecabacter sp.]